MARANMKQLRKWVSEEAAKEPAIGEGKRAVGVCLLISIVLRVFTIGAELVCAAGGIVEFTASNIASFVVSLLFAWMIYHGVGVLAYLPIVGGVVMVVQAILNAYPTVVLSNEYWPQARIYALLFLLNGLYQAGAFLFLVLNRKTKLYFATYKRAEAAFRSELPPIK